MKNKQQILIYFLLFKICNKKIAILRSGQKQNDNENHQVSS